MATDPEQPPIEDPIYGDIFGPLQNPLSIDLMQAFMRLPAALSAQFEGDEGPVDLPPEEAAEAYRNALQAFMRHLPNIAGALDITRVRLTRLEQEVRNQGENPQGGGPRTNSPT